MQIWVSLEGSKISLKLNLSKIWEVYTFICSSDYFCIFKCANKKNTKNLLALLNCNSSQTICYSSVINVKIQSAIYIFPSLPQVCLQHGRVFTDNHKLKGFQSDIHQKTDLEGSSGEHLIHPFSKKFNNTYVISNKCLLRLFLSLLLKQASALMILLFWCFYHSKLPNSFWRSAPTLFLSSLCLKRELPSTPIFTFVPLQLHLISLQPFL